MLKYIVLQLILFILFYLVWRKDCDVIGKDYLAVSLKERFVAWLIFCPICVLSIIKYK